MNKYEIFVETVEKGSLTKAAESLNYTQSGVSYAITALEEEVGYQLLNREKKGVSLTVKGEHFYPIVLDIVNSQRRLDQEINAMQNNIAGTLRVGCFPSVASAWLPSLLSDFLGLYPNVQFDIFDGDYEEEVRLLVEKRIDCAFLPETVTRSGFSFYPLFNDHLYAILPKGHPLAEYESIQLDDFLQYQLILQNSGNNAVVNQLLAHGSRPPSVIYTLCDDASIIRFVEGGLGVSIVAGLYKKNCNADILFKPFSLEGDRVIGLAVPDLKRMSAVTKAFFEFLKSYDFEELSS